MSDGSSFSPSAADSCGATTMIPSADWARSRSTPSPIERRFSELRLMMLTLYPCSRAACSILNTVEAGPYSVVSKLTTPSTPDRPVASTRAAELGR